MKKALSLSLAIVIGAWAQASDAHENEVDIRLEGDQLCVISNSSPNHGIGQFPVLSPLLSRHRQQRFHGATLKSPQHGL